MKTITLDFETFWDSDYTLSKMSPLEYVMDPRFEVISVSMKVDDYPTDVFFGHAEVEGRSCGCAPLRWRGRSTPRRAG